MRDLVRNIAGAVARVRTAGRQFGESGGDARQDDLEYRRLQIRGRR